MHLSRESLAELCDFHPTYIGQLERGEKNATLETISRLYQGFGIPLSKLLEDIDSMDSASNSVPLDVYHRLMQLSAAEQKKVASILLEIMDLTQKNV